MARENVQGAVDETTLTEFLQRADTYIRENPRRVGDRDVTLEMLLQKPSLYVHCQSRANGTCPDQQYKSPSCDKCDSARTAVRTLRRVGPQHGFSVDNITHEFHEIGTLMCLARHSRSHEPLSFEVDGREVDGHDGGVVTFSLHNVRQPFE